MDETVDIALSDIKLGPMLGTDLMKEIKKQHDIPVIMITAYASTDTAIDSVKNNAFDYLLKPCDPEEILRAIKAAGEVVTKKNLQEKSKTEFLNKLRAMKED
jgi:DNA-binding NtrC family response regulator